ncbi:hypothetical protein [Bosea lathyri]|uniref:Uncharacterized protein n=1 Tax=Bosea lathyri TaxID=1036778 RepID=A0A1H6C741_9HYPH|nr:hypothetical protein [Bosea lathyri]SEG68723.1 hypothetical protein SAMN04488115_10981 [Bosea lathyri]
MDLIVWQNGKSRWSIEDLLSRSAGYVELSLNGAYRVVIGGKGLRFWHT